MDLEEFLANVGQTSLCSRCGALVQVGQKRNPKARIMRLSKVPEGYCANCAMTLWLRGIEPVATLLKRRGCNVLLLEPVQNQAWACVVAAQGDANRKEINWEAIVATWDLPVGKESR